MSNSEVMNKIAGFASRAMFQCKKHSPEILAVGGVVSIVASTVFACKATTKVSTIINDAKDDIQDVHACLENPKFKDSYSVEDSKKDLTIIYAKTGVQLIKIYAPAVIFGVAGIGMLLTSNGILRSRCAATAAAYATLDKVHNDYRKRVVDRFGEEVDRELRYNIKAQEIEETVVDEKGKEKKVKKTVKVVDPDAVTGVHTRIFDEYCTGWEKDKNYNQLFLRSQERYCNDLLVARGHLFLNEVYDLLGMQKTEEGNIVGWLYDLHNPNLNNHVSFGIYENMDDPNVREFINGNERSIILSFNPDGVILDKAFDRKK